MKKQLFFLMVLMFAGANIWAQGTTRNVPGDYATIQLAIDAASAGDVIQVAAGTFSISSQVNINKGVEIKGVGPTTIFDISAVVYSQFEPAAFLVAEDDVTLSDFVITGYNASGPYVIKPALGGTTFTEPIIENLTITNVAINNVKRTAFDFNGLLESQMSNISVNGVTNGFGLAVSNSSLNVTIDGLTTLNCAWGDAAVYPWANNTAFYPIGIEFNTLNLNEGNGAIHVQPFDQIITISTFDNTDAVYDAFADVKVPDEYNHVVYNLRNDGSKTYSIMMGEAKAKVYAQQLCAAVTPFTYSGITVRNYENGKWLVFEGMSIADAIDAADDGDEIIVAAGTFTAQTSVTKGVTVKAAEGVRPTIVGGFIILPAALANENTVRIEGFDIQASPLVDKAIMMHGCYDEVPAKVIIHNNWFHGMIGGIDLWGVENGLPDGWTSGVTNVEITDNKFYDMVSTTTAQGFGILIEDPVQLPAPLPKYLRPGFSILIENNEFSNLPSYLDDKGTDLLSSGFGIAIGRYWVEKDAQSIVEANVHVVLNSFNDDVPVGIALLNVDAQPSIIERNSFESTLGIVVHTSIYKNGDPTVNAQCNWWGSIIKSEVLTKIQGDGVGYIPYLLSDNLETAVCNGSGNLAYNVRLEKYYETAQLALVDVDILEGDEIEVYYNPGHLDIEMKLNIHYIFNRTPR